MFIYIWETKAKRDNLFAKETALLLVLCSNKIDWHLLGAYHDKGMLRSLPELSRWGTSYFM